MTTMMIRTRILVELRTSKREIKSCPLSMMKIGLPIDLHLIIKEQMRVVFIRLMFSQTKVEKIVENKQIDSPET